MAASAVAADFHQPLDVHRDLLAKIAFHAALLLEHAADLAHVVLGEVLHPDVRAHARFRKDLVRAVPPDAIDVGEADFDALGARQIDASNSRHVCLSLPLFVFLIRANHSNHAAPADDLALIANALD